jgi:hypothetical protein
MADIEDIDMVADVLLLPPPQLLREDHKHGRADRIARMAAIAS